MTDPAQVRLGDLATQRADDRIAAGHAAARVPAGDAVTGKAAVLSWDWREQPDLDRLGELLFDLSHGGIYLYQVETGSDQYAVVLATVPLDTRATGDLYSRTLTGGDDPGVVAVEAVRLKRLRAKETT